MNEHATDEVTTKYNQVHPIVKWSAGITSLAFLFAAVTMFNGHASGIEANTNLINFNQRLYEIQREADRSTLANLATATKELTKTTNKLATAVELLKVNDQ